MPILHDAPDSWANDASTDGGPTNLKSLLKELPPGPGNVLQRLYEPVIPLSNECQPLERTVAPGGMRSRGIPKGEDAVAD